MCIYIYMCVRDFLYFPNDSRHFRLPNFHSHSPHSDHVSMKSRNCGGPRRSAKTAWSKASWWRVCWNNLLKQGLVGGFNRSDK